MCHAIHRYAEENNKNVKNYYKNIKSSYLTHLHTNTSCGWEMSQKLPVNGFEWEENIRKFNEDFIKNYDEDSNEGYFFEVDENIKKRV